MRSLIIWAAALTWHKPGSQRYCFFHLGHRMKMMQRKTAADSYNHVARARKKSFEDQALSLWSRSADSKTLDYQGSNIAAAAAAAAESLQSCPPLCDPIDGSPPGSPVPGILQARTLEWVAISFSNA